MNHRKGPLDLAVESGMDALIAVREAERDVRRAFRNLKVAEARILTANQIEDTASYATQAKSA